MNRYTPYSKKPDKKGPPNYDRHCQECGIVIKGAAHQKPENCFKCQSPQEGRRGWNEDGWGRCADCDGWMNRNHCYCLCGYANVETIQRKRQQLLAAKQQEAFRKEQEAVELRRMLGEANRMNMVLQQQIDERAAEEERRQNNDIFVRQMEGVNLDQDDEQNADN